MAAGNHLQVLRQHGLFNHHGIDLGDGTVAHYLEGRAILRSSLKEFCAGEIFSIVSHKNPSPNSVIIRRAMSRLGEQSYNLLFNNCEHFANWCTTGRHRSNQMENWLKQSSLGAMAIGQLMPAALFAGLNLLITKGLEDDSSREKARKGINNLQTLRKKILQKLQVTLDEIDNWFKSELHPNTMKTKKQNKQLLLLKGQDLADQLNTIENVEAQIIRLLHQSNPKN